MQALNNLLFFLKPGGYLLVGPSETPFINHPLLHTRQISNLTIFQKDMSTISKPAIPSLKKTEHLSPHNPSWAAQRETSRKEQHLPRQVPKESPARRHTASLNQRECYHQALGAYAQGNYRRSVAILSNHLDQSPHKDSNLELSADICHVLAQCHANLNEMTAAQDFCQKAIDRENLNPRHYYLLSIIYQGQDLLQEAMQCLRQVLYLDPECIMANFSLAILLRKEHSLGNPDKYLQNALHILQNLHSETTVPLSDGLSAGRLKAIIETLLTKKAI
jgi:tetratricopeptide (TPR) repeat protein